MIDNSSKNNCVRLNNQVKFELKVLKCYSSRIQYKNKKYALQ